MQRGLTGYFLPIPSPGEECRAFVPHAFGLLKRLL